MGAGTWRCVWSRSSSERQEPQRRASTHTSEVDVSVKAWAEEERVSDEAWKKPHTSFPAASRAADAGAAPSTHHRQGPARARTSRGAS